MNNDKMSADSVEAEYLDIAQKNAWPLVYQTIGRECQLYPYTCTEAKKPQNKPLNRYRDVNPFDHTRIVLKRCERDYINANLVTMEHANRKYILTQGPLALTVGHFWLMVWEQGSRAIIMLSKIIEKNEIKCHWYWPRDIGENDKITLSDVKLTVEQISDEYHGYYTTRKFRLVDMETEDSREVVQFHYTTWPDFGVPTSPVAFVEFLRKVRESGALEPDVGPAIVHCSAGIGRSGTFCLVDSCLVILQKGIMGFSSIRDVVLQLRRDRMGLIQTPDQLRFSYQAILEGVKRLDPNFVEDVHNMDESIYSTVSEESHESDRNDNNVMERDESPPPPPPRLASLARPPIRPLPAIPNTMSLGNLRLLDLPSLPRSSSSKDKPPTPPPRESPTPSRSSSRSRSRSTSSADEPDPDAGNANANNANTESEAYLRRKRKAQRDLSERVSDMKRRAKSAERWNSLKRFRTEQNSSDSEPCED